MQCVKQISDIKENIQTLDKYLDSKCDPEYTFALKLVKKGTCFIAVKSKDGYKFYPSRFMGYAGNTMDKHLNNTQKDGKETNPVISHILNKKLINNKGLEKAYKEYCEKLGFTANEKGSFGVERKYCEME